MGVLFAFLALLCWGFGDFQIQKSTRKIGDVLTLFYLDLIGALALLPFVFKDIKGLIFDTNALIILIIASAVLVAAALLEFQALKTGKISVVEPVFSFELFITTVLAAVIISELPGLKGLLALAGMALGILFVSVKSFSDLRRLHLEKGVWIALIATFTMAFVNFLFGIGARATSPLMINWFTSLFVLAVTILIITISGRWNEVKTDLRTYPKLIAVVGAVDNMAWIFFAYSMSLIPIAIATGISEGYIALTALLGIVYGHEKLLKHQKAGLVIVIISVIALGFIGG